MKVIGLTDELRDNAELQFAEGFHAWIVEAKEGTWGNWEELKKHYPAVCQMSEDEAHFPLKSEGTGIRAMVFFKTRLLILRCIAPAPMTSRISHRRRISLPPTTKLTQATATHKP